MNLIVYSVVNACWCILRHEIYICISMQYMIVHDSIVLSLVIGYMIRLGLIHQIQRNIALHAEWKSCLTLVDDTQTLY